LYGAQTRACLAIFGREWLACAVDMVGELTTRDGAATLRKTGRLA
jgi:hypothetical protein